MNKIGNFRLDYIKYCQFMLELSQHEIHFEDGITTKFINITNLTNSILIYKIKLTNVNVFQIKPGKGYINSHAKFTLNIRITTNSQVNAKMLICYAQRDTQTSTIFEIEWGKITKENIKTEMVVLSRENKPNVTILKQTESPIYQSLVGQSLKESCYSFENQQMLESKSSKSKNINESNAINPSKLLSLGVNSSKTIQFSDKALKNQIQLKLEEEMNKNKQMRKQLDGAQRQLKDFQQVHINRAFRLNCDENHISLGMIGLIAFICFILGFCLAKIDITKASL